MKTIDLTPLYVQQAELDKTIAVNHHITYDSTRISRTLALLVEMGELCNETRCFKYWSNKGPSSKEIILEEYADALHFFLSLGIDLNIKNKVFKIDSSSIPINEQFLNIYSSIIEFVHNRDELHYNNAFTQFLNLGMSLGYSHDEIFKSYLKKLDTNYKRQKNNY